MVTTLRSRQMQLAMSSERSGWCRVALCAAGHSVPLGAEMQSVIVDKLLLGLAEELRRPVGSIDGVEVCRVLSLAEGHTTIYAGTDGMKRLLFCQDGRGNLLARIELTDDERQSWIRELKRQRRRD